MSKNKAMTAVTAKEDYPYPSRFSSHASMVDDEATALMNDENHIVCKDEYGSYITLRERLDSGIADPNRYTAARFSDFLKKEKKR